jgi:S1-C subfamily serine protease
MISRAATVSFLIVVTAMPALAQQGNPAFAERRNPWTVSVVHVSDVNKIARKLREQQKGRRVGVPASGPRYVYNVATGLVLDSDGYVVTRLANLDPEDKDPNISITTSDGRKMPAQFVGIDCPTGFTILKVDSLKLSPLKQGGTAKLSAGDRVRILSTDVKMKTVATKGGEKRFLYPAPTSLEGQIGNESLLAKSRGAWTLYSNNLLSRYDSSVVTTPEDQVIGIAQYAAFGRAYIYSVEFVRDTVARRVIENKGSVAAGWLGAMGQSIAQLPDSEVSALGLERKSGVIVRQVQNESPAAAGGVMPNDVIVGLDSAEVTSVVDLGLYLASSPAGRAVKLRAIRNREPVELNVTLGAWPLNSPPPSLFAVEERLGNQQQQLDRLAELGAQYRRFLNSPPSLERNEALRELEIEIRQTNDRIRLLTPGGPEQSGSEPESKSDYPHGDFVSRSDFAFDAGFAARDLPEQIASNTYRINGGVWVTRVIKDSPADRAGIMVGDVIVGAHDSIIVKAADLYVIYLAQRKNLTLKIMRRDQQIIEVKLGSE